MTLYIVIEVNRIMGKDSEFYKGKRRDQTLRLRELLTRLPGFAVDYIHSKDVSTQISTRISYAYDLITFFEYMLNIASSVFKNKYSSITEFRLDDIEKFTSEDIIEYQRYLELNVEENGKYHENGKKSIARKMAPLRGLYEYHYLHKNIHENPMLLVPLPRLKKDKNIIRMDNQEVRDILNAVEHTIAGSTERQKKALERTKHRDLAILTLMLNTGIRVSELNGLDLTDVDLRANTLVIVRKGGGQDVLYFNDTVHDALEEYIDGERKLINPREGQEKALFFSTHGNRISVDAVEKLVKKYARVAVPNKKITPHKLRSTYGTALYRETGDIRLVADVLGHENVNTTIDYYAAIEDEHKRAARNAVDFNRKDVT